MLHSAIQLDQVADATEAPLALAVVIPTFNETENVRTLLERLSLSLAGISWEAIFVDDNSPDGTAEAIRAIGLHSSRVRVLQRIGRRGLSSAVIEGMLATSAPVIAVIDADLQHDETILPQLYRAVAEDGNDLAVGTRYAEGGGVGEWNAQRHAASRLATKISHLMTGVELSDPMSGFFAISRPALMEALPRVSGVGFKILLDIAASPPRAFSVAEIPYRFGTREAGDSKMGPLVAAEYLGLLVEKKSGGVLTPRLMSFLTVGAIGVAVHLAILGSCLAAGIWFEYSQTIAVICAMTFNFFLNNVFTYRDRRLVGWKIVPGLLSFYAICAMGAAANIGVGTWVNDSDGRWWIAGVAGAAVGAIWNFAVSSVLTWRK